MWREGEVSRCVGEWEWLLHWANSEREYLEAHWESVVVNVRWTAPWSVLLSSHIRLPGLLSDHPRPLDLQRTDSQSLMPGVSEAKPTETEPQACLCPKIPSLLLG